MHNFVYFLCTKISVFENIGIEPNCVKSGSWKSFQIKDDARGRRLKIQTTNENEGSLFCLNVGQYESVKKANPRFSKSLITNMVIS